MQQIDKQAIKNKAFVMDTIMRDSKLAKSMMDAWNSPAGSTKNTKAKSILNSLHKTRQSYSYITDGKGGPGGATMSQNPLEAFMKTITKNATQPTANPATLDSGATVSASAPTPETNPFPNQGMAMPPSAQLAADPTTPNITAEQIKSAFNSFGYEPDLNNMNDTGYWMTKPVNEVNKLMSELRKRREKDNAILEERNQKIEIESRLTPERIKQIYDVYGLSEQADTDEDIDRIQRILPNNEEALIKVLDAEQKRKLSSYKEKLTPNVKANSGANDGKGGPGPATIPPNPLGELLKSVKPYTQTNPFFSLPSPTSSSNYGVNIRRGTAPALPTSQMTSSIMGLPSGIMGLPSGPPSTSGLSFNAQTGKIEQGVTSPITANPQYGFNQKTGMMEKLIPGITSKEMGWEIPQVAKTKPTTPITLAPRPSAWTQDTINKEYDKFIKAGYSPEEAKSAIKRLTNLTPTTTTPSDFAGLTSKIAETAIKPWYETTSVEEAATSGIGPTAFGMNILSDRKKLAKFLGMPESALESFMPKESGLLSAQLAGIYEAEAKAHGLDEAYQSMTEAANRNLNIEDNLSAYIRGKDEYLGSIDKLIDQGLDIMAYTDTSDPYVAKQLGNYMNYLNILQGRQNTRYINMLDLAIKYDNNQYQQATNLYNATEKKVTDDYNRIGAVTTEFYNTTMSMIKEMYDNVTGRDESLRKVFDFELKKLEATDKVATTALSIIEKTSKLGLPIDINSLSALYPKGADESNIEYEQRLNDYAAGIKTTGTYDKITNLDIANNLMGITVDSKTGEIKFTDYNPLSAVDTASKSQNYDPTMLLKQYTQATGTNLYRKSQTGNFESELDAYGPGLSDMATVAENNPAFSNIYTEMLRTIESSLAKGIEEFLTSKIDTLKSAIKSLTGEGIFTGVEKDRTKFIQKFSGLGDVAGLLFDMNAAMGGIGLSSIVNDKKVLNELSTKLAQRAIYNPAQLQ